MVTSRLDDTYAGSLLPAVKQVNEVLPPTYGGRSRSQEYALSSNAVQYRMPVRVSRPEADGQLMYYDRTAAATSATRSIGPRVYVEKGTYVDTWA